MPPKAKSKTGAKAAKPKGSGGKSRTSSATEREGTSDDSQQKVIDNLRTEVEALKQVASQEQEDRNFFQMERDRVVQFWEVSKKELEERNVELRLRESEMEELGERHRVEVKAYKQKLKHLLFENQNNVSEVKIGGESALKSLEDEHREREAEYKREQRTLKVTIKEKELSHEEVMKNMEHEHEKQVTKLRQEFERELADTRLRFERKAKAMREELELRRKQEIHEIEERKNSHINELMRKHEKAFNEIKEYYKEIAHNNLELITKLKDDIAEMEKRKQTNEKLMLEIARENKRLVEPYEQTLKELGQLKYQLANYEKDKQSLQHAKARVLVLEDQLKSLSWEHEVLEQRFERMQKERDDLYEKFEEIIYDVQQKSGLKNLLLEKKVDAVRTELERKEAQLTEVIRASQLEPEALQNITNQLNSVLSSKNETIQGLKFDLARITQTHDNMVQVVEQKLHEYGITLEEVGVHRVAHHRTASSVA